MVDLLKYLAILIIPLCYVVFSSRFPTLSYRHLLLKRSSTRPEQAPAEKDPKKQLKTVMQPPREDLEPPKDQSFTKEELKEYDGSDTEKPIYVAVKGTVFDVSTKRDVYGANKSYNVFAGKDGSKGLGMSSLKPEHAVPEYQSLPEHERQVLEDWYSFFEKRYNIMGKIVDSPVPESSD